MRYRFMRAPCLFPSALSTVRRTIQSQEGWSVYEAFLSNVLHFFIRFFFIILIRKQPNWSFSIFRVLSYIQPFEFYFFCLRNLALFWWDNIAQVYWTVLRLDVQRLFPISVRKDVKFDYRRLESRRKSSCSFFRNKYATAVTDSSNIASLRIRLDSGGRLVTSP